MAEQLPPQRLPSKAEPHTPPEPSLGETSTMMKTALSDFVKARVELASIEGKEAASFIGKQAAYGIILAISLLFTWALILVGITGVTAPLLDPLLAGKASWLPGWVLVIFILAALHAIIAAIFCTKLKKKPEMPLFELSRQEIQKDKQWLSKN